MTEQASSELGTDLLLGPIFDDAEFGMAGPASGQQDFKKATPPKLGEAFGVRWGDEYTSFQTLPGGGVIQFNLDRLTLSDFRQMRDHYQVNASLSVLTFMMHQLDWQIECEDKRIQAFCQANMDEIWTRLIHAISQAFWAGYSPNVLQWENDISGRSVQLTKIKDLLPEECQVNWKTIEGWAPEGRAKPKLKVYDGIKQASALYPIPVENSFWYSLLSENGNLYGRKLLRPAFVSWYFSILMHLFSNRYFERFGEPIPVGRAPYNDTVEIDGKAVNGREAMLTILGSLRNRSAVVLPDDRTQQGTTGESKYDYTIEYLESQMRGADFERYLMRLDEEISLALFTPLLMLRTADVGSYNLGVTHAQVYMQMLNALSGDAKQYIDSYILSRMVDFNFGIKAKRARIRFRKLGSEKTEMVKALLQQLFAGGKVMPDLKEMGDIAGLTLHEVEVLTDKQPAADPNVDPGTDPVPSDPNADPKQNASKLIADIQFRVTQQANKAISSGTLDEFKPSLGYEKQFVEVYTRLGVPEFRAREVYGMLATCVAEASQLQYEKQSDKLLVIHRAIKHAGEDLLAEAR